MRYFFLSLLGFIVSTGVLAATRAGTIIYVDESAAAGGDGTSWATAYRDLQDGFQAVGAGTAAIWIAEGTYTPDRGTGDAGASFTLVAAPEFSILGGFPSGGGDLDARDPAAHETVLSGDLGGDDVVTFEPAVFGDDGLPDNGGSAGVHFENTGDNSEHVLQFVFGGGPIDFDGLTIEGGNSPLRNGAIAINDTPVRFRSVTFRENYAQSQGGVTFVIAEEALFDHCVFERNAAGNGGVVHFDGGDAEFIGCRFSENDRYALFIDGDSPRVLMRDCDVERNLGTAVLMDRRSTDTLLDVEGCRFTENISTGFGSGAIFVDGNAWTGDSMIIRDSVLQRNRAFGSGAIHVGSSHALIQGCEFDSNIAYNHGGALGVENDGELVRVEDCRFVSNIAGQNGGAVWAPEIVGPAAILTGCDLIGNRAEGRTPQSRGGGGLYGGVAIRCRFIGNEAVDQGAALVSGYGGGSHLSEAYGCLYIGNRARYGGGWSAFTTSGYVAESCVFIGNSARFGGAVRGGGGLIHSTVVGNHAEELHGGVRYSPILYSIVWGNTDVQSTTVLDQQVGDEPNFIGWSDSLIEGWTADGNSGEWPGFIDYLGPDGVPASGDENLRVGLGSPAIDGGSESHEYCIGTGPESIDFDQLPRCVDTGSGISRTDIGAYEYAGSVRCGIADPAEPFGVLDLADLVAFVSAFQNLGWNGDLAEPYGVWDLADIVRFVSVFSAGCP